MLTSAEATPPMSRDVPSSSTESIPVAIALPTSEPPRRAESTAARASVYGSGSGVVGSVRTGVSIGAPRDGVPPRPMFSEDPTALGCKEHGTASRCGIGLELADATRMMVEIRDEEILEKMIGLAISIRARRHPRFATPFRPRIPRLAARRPA